MQQDQTILNQSAGKYGAKGMTNVSGTYAGRAVGFDVITDVVLSWDDDSDSNNADANILDAEFPAGKSVMWPMKNISVTSGRILLMVLPQ